MVIKRNIMNHIFGRFSENKERV